MFVVFEGVDGAGKGTQIDKCCAYLDRYNINHVRTREPGGTSGAEAIRNLLVSGEVDRFDGMSELLMMYAARHLHVKNIIEPALADGKWVICDRFSGSSYVYQGFAGGVGLETVRQLHETVLGPLTPDVEIILDLPVSVSLERIKDRSHDENRFESKGLLFMESVRNGFLQYANEKPTSRIVIDARESVECIHQQIIAELMDRAS